MNTHFGTEKCATCEYWLGERKIDTNGKGNPIVRSTEKDAGCRNKKSRFFGATKQDKNRCNQYKQWNKITE